MGVNENVKLKVERKILKLLNFYKIILFSPKK